MDKPSFPSDTGAPQPPRPSGGKDFFRRFGEHGDRLERAWAATVRAFRRYADWLSQQSWKRLVLLALLAIVVVGILSSIPPFSTHWGATEATVIRLPGHGPSAEERARIRAAAAAARAHADRARQIAEAARKGHYDIQVDDQGVHIKGRINGADEAASAARDVASAVLGSAPSSPQVPQPPAPPGPDSPLPHADIKLPPNADSEDVRDAIEQAKDQIQEALESAAQAQEEAAKAQEDVAQEIRVKGSPGFSLGEQMMPLLMIVIVASVIIKIMGTGRRKAEAQAAVATERAESESLRRQVIEARMAAMQAQVEPHFLFNTLASIDHLIETDPPRASQMQRNLIALLRASMPTMRETANAGPRPLERELAVIRPYLEILKVRMEERLQTEIDVPDGLLSAEFPPMMIQSLVENAIKHGLEPKAEGGTLTVKAEIRHGKLCVTVADTGLGFGRAATAGTGVGLANIRERLQLLYGPKASLTVTANQPSGTVVTITVPYTHRADEGAAS
jgi:signal transduction histidine kinase